MSKIYLPNYIATAESIRALTLSKIDANLVTIKIRNYNVLETLVSNVLLEDIILSIEDTIKEFYSSNAIIDFKIISIRDFIFVTYNQTTPNLTADLRKALYYNEFPIYISFGLMSSYGQISMILPRLVQNLAYVEDGISPLLDNSIITHEYRTLSLLKKALNNKTAGFAYQPIIDGRDGSVAYHECLMRIPDQNGEWISAGPAIILAEKYGIIDIVDHAVITMAEEELRSSDKIDISVNISNICLLNASLLEKIVKVFKGNEGAKRLIIEVTETSENEDLEKTLHFVDTVRALGIRVALDDFGVGNRSFKQLYTIKFDIIKIDGSFIKDIATNPYHRFITEMVVKLSKDTGAKAVAEFVENGEVAKILIDLGVDFMQGNFFSPAQNFRSWHK